MRRKLQALERNRRFPPRSRQLFEELLGRVGVASTREISLPVSDQPFWFRAGHPLANYQSAPTLPPLVDVLIIGAGLTGASAAYHLGPAARDRSLRVAVIDRGDPATEASGRNAGNFELLPENSVGLYGGLARERLQFLLHVYPSVPIEVLHAESERQASLVLGMALRNRDRLQQIIDEESIDCDFSPRGGSTSPTPTAKNRECARKSARGPARPAHRAVVAAENLRGVRHSHRLRGPVHPG